MYFLFMLTLGILGFGVYKFLTLETIKRYFRLKRKQVKLEDHPIFSSKIRLEASMRNFPTEDQIKFNVFVDILQITTDDIYDYIFELKDERFKTKQEFINHINLDKPILISKYKFIDLCKNKYRNGSELADYVLDIFNNIRITNLNNLRSIMSLLETDSFKTVEEAKYYFFSIVLIVLENSIIESEVAFRDLNGHIKEIVER